MFHNKSPPTAVSQSYIVIKAFPHVCIVKQLCVSESYNHVALMLLIAGVHVCKNLAANL